MNIVTFCDLRSGGPQELKPLVNALQDFFSLAKKTSDEDKSLRHVHVFDSTAIRRELFKLNYHRAEYVLNSEADAFECLDYLLTVIHTWTQAANNQQNSPL